MNFDELKTAFHKRVPMCLPETFIIDRNKIIKLLDTIRESEVTQKDLVDVDEKTDQTNIFIPHQREILYQLLLTRNKKPITREEAISSMIKIIKNWNTTYHPTEADYKRLAEQIFDFLQKEKIIFLISDKTSEQKHR